ncbi:unnamed protein product [Candidula unifasciata]|uniref:RING-type domain-containing protein n=1 Tax=Candidula unifasciata TaxID=100452 RepID=A0A8S3Z171_9EUPU|nr:unnamed protein product [Candidula unifasciata]
MSNKHNLPDLLRNNAACSVLAVIAGIQFECLVRVLHRIGKSKQDTLFNILCHILKLKMRQCEICKNAENVLNNHDCDNSFKKLSEIHISEGAYTKLCIKETILNKSCVTDNNILKFLTYTFFCDLKVLLIKTKSKEIPLNKHKVSGIATDKDLAQMVKKFFSDLKDFSIVTESKETQLRVHEDKKPKLKSVELNGSSSITDVGECVKSKPVSYKTEQQNDSRNTDGESQLLDLWVKQKQIPTTAPVYHVYMTQVKSHPQTVNGIPWNLLNAEQFRLVTFAQYPHTAKKSAILLANEGFAYCGSGRDEDDTVICYFCCALKQGWHESEDIQAAHRILSPDCCMVTGANCNNIPMTLPVNGESLFTRFYSPDVANENTTQSARYKRKNELECDGSEGSTLAENRNNVAAQASQASRDIGSVPVSELSKSVNQTDVRPGASNTPMNLESTRPNAAHNHPVNSGAPSHNVSSNSSLVSPSSASVIPNGTPAVSAQLGSVNNVSSTETAAASSRQATAVQTPGSDRQPTIQQTTATSPSHVNQSPQNSASVGGTTTSTNQSTQNSASAGGTTSTNQSASQPQGNSSESATGNAQNKAPTYGDLGIITERPKRFEYAVTATRFASFEHWPRDHPLKKEDLAEAGFYYAGYGDCARCFYCGGGLRNWEDDDNVWVEHARWFPKCAYIRQTVGQQFVDTVQELNKHNDKITYKMVTDKMGSSAASFQLDTRSMPLKRDPAVLTVLEMGYCEKDVIEAAKYVKDTYGTLSSDKVFEKLEMDGKSRSGADPLASPSGSSKRGTNPAKDEQVMNKLKEENSQLRQQTVCKICMDKEVAVVFLPCGHFVSCTDCAAAMKDCPVCRKQVRGIVRAFMG